MPALVALHRFRRSPQTEDFSETMLALPVAIRATVLDAVLQEEECSDRPRPDLCHRPRSRSLFHEMIVLLAHEADDSLEQRVAWIDEGCDGLLVDLALLEADALILLLERRAASDLAVPFSNTERDMGDLPAAFIAALDLATEVLECLDEEALDVMRLETLSFGSLHLEPQLVHARRRHGVIGQLPALEQVQEMAVDRRRHRLFEAAWP
jgi:hypothetical protein